MYGLGDPITCQLAANRHSGTRWMSSRPECRSPPIPQRRCARVDTNEVSKYSQLQTNAVAGEGYNGMFDCFSKIIKNEG